MIEFHEIEYFHSPLEDDALRVILNFVPDLIPREAYDQLLYRGDKYVRLHNQRFKRGVEARVKRNHSGRYPVPRIKARDIQEDAQKKVSVSL